VQKRLTAEDAESAEKNDNRLVARYPMQVMGSEILVETPLLGRHQLRNVALAVAAAEELANQGFAISAATIERGIRETRWPGRFHVIPRSEFSPEFVLDVAHNPAGAWALRSTLSNCYEDRRIILVFGAMRDKAIGEIAEILFPLAERVIVTSADNPRSATPEEIRKAAARTQSDIELAGSVQQAIDRARVLASSDKSVRPTRSGRSDGVVVITGSIYVVGEAMRALGVGSDGK
jgi:dihydrofolate synthase/folylpolyglutamate synthase